MKSWLGFAWLLLGACAAGPLPPEWEARTEASLKRFTRLYFDGNSRQAERAFADAQSAVAATGDPRLAARVELARCAIGTAALEFSACAGYEALQGDATDEDRAYGRMLFGQLQPGDARRLPARYRAFASVRNADTQNRAMRGIEDPVSRLVAAGALFRTADLSPGGLAAAVDTASARGFRRPLLAFLTVQAKLANAAGATQERDEIQKRIELVYQSMPKGNE